MLAVDKQTSYIKDTSNYLSALPTWTVSPATDTTALQAALPVPGFHHRCRVNLFIFLGVFNQVH